MFACLRRAGLELIGIECLAEAPHVVRFSAHKSGAFTARAMMTPSRGQG
jgi:hypothetical protein